MLRYVKNPTRAGKVNKVPDKTYCKKSVGVYALYAYFQSSSQTYRFLKDILEEYLRTKEKVNVGEAGAAKYSNK